MYRQLGKDNLCVGSISVLNLAAPKPATVKVSNCHLVVDKEVKA
jgi:hypothetical protein